MIAVLVPRPGGVYDDSGCLPMDDLEHLIDADLHTLDHYKCRREVLVRTYSEEGTDDDHE